MFPQSRSLSAIPILDRVANSCGPDGFSIFPKNSMGLKSSPNYDCVMPIGVLYHCQSVSTATQCIRSHLGPAVADFSAAAQASGGAITATESQIEPWVSTASYVVEVVNPTLLALSLVSNLMVLVVLCRMRSGINSFLLSGCLAQIFYVLSIFLLRLIDYSTDYSNHVFHTEGRVYIHHLSYLFWLVLLWQLLAASVERILTGFTPDSVKHQCSALKADFVNLFIWLSAFGLTFPLLWYSKLQRMLGYGDAGHPLACSILYWFQMVFSIFIPYPSLLILSVMLIASLVKQHSSVRKITLGSNGELWRQRVEEDAQLTRLVCVQVILFFLLSGGYAISQLVLTLNLAADQTTCMWSMLIDLFQLGPLLYGALQFILFGCIVEKFAIIFRNMCCRCCGKSD